MYQRIKNSLLYPKKLATEYKKGVVGFVVFLIILSSLPFILYTCVNGLLSNSDIRNIKMTFYEASPVEYRIENHELVCYAEVRDNRYLTINSGSIGIAFITNPDEDIIVNESLVISLETEGVFLYSTTVMTFKYKIANYDNLSDLDFKEASDLDNNKFWNMIFAYVDDVINDLKFTIYPSYFSTILIQMTISILLGILTNAVIIVLFDRTPGLKFKEVFKNTSVAFFPYVITTILAYAFNLALLQYLGNVISFIYAMIANNEYRKIKYKEYSLHE